MTKKQQQQQKQKKSLNKEQTFAPRVFHSVSVRLRDKQIGDEGCAEACEERFSALKDQH